MTEKPTTESAENPQHSRSLNYVPPAELDLYRQDPAREARLKISDYVVCRVCGATPKFPMSGRKGHLWARHKMSTQQYRGAYSGARIRSFKVSARNAIGRPGRCSDVRKLMVMFAESYVPPAELELYRQDAAREARLEISDSVVCRVCGAKIKTTLSGSRSDHLLAAHRLDLAQYRMLWPGAPRASVACATAISKASIRWAKNHPDEVRGHQARYYKKPEIRKKRGTYSRNYARQVREFAKIGRQLSQQAPGTEPGLAPPPNKGGRPPGMEPDTWEEGRQLDLYISDFVREHGSKKGAMPYAARKVYGPTLESHKAVARGNKTLRKYKASLKLGTKPAA